MVPGIQLVKDSRVREMRIVAAKAHHLVFFRHLVGRIRNENLLAAEEEWSNALTSWTHHLHVPVFFRKLWYRHPVMLRKEIFGLSREVADEIGLLAGLDVGLLHLFHRRFPV